MADEVLCEIADGVATITLNRPDSLNAVDEAAKRELGKHIKSCRRDEAVRCVILTGAGRAFSSGQDLKELKAAYADEDHTPHLGEFLRNQYNPIISNIRKMEKPVIAAVNGVAAGAGCSLALACDLRIAGESAVFVQSFVHVGLIPDSGATYFMPRLIGLARAAELAFTGEKVDARRAYEIGLVNLVIADAELMSYTNNLARKLAALPTRSIALTKRLLNQSFANTLDAQLEAEAFAQETAGLTQDHLEGVRAFMEKRKPGFVGK
jgi:2-(1,2-epoxy-1,2-dihydrophenyl)acetyl-CoA isomerase